MIYIIAASQTAAQLFIDIRGSEYAPEECVAVKDAHDFWNTCRPRVVLLHGFEAHPDLPSIRDELRCRAARVEYAV